MEDDATTKLSCDELLILFKQSQASNGKLLAQNEQLHDALLQLQQQFDKLQRMLFGQKSERQRFYRWLISHRDITPPKSPVGKAIQYTLNHWQALKNYCRDGVLSIDNNRAERAMKTVVIGRKNYLFAGSHQGAKHAATIYSLIQTCKLLGINTIDYLSDVLARLPTTLADNVQSLIPYNWKPLA